MDNKQPTSIIKSPKAKNNLAKQRLYMLYQFVDVSKANNIDVIDIDISDVREIID